MIAAFIINAILAILTGIGLAVTNVESMGFSGCMLYGAVLGVSGLLFASVTALFCQLSSNSRGAVGFSFLTLGLFYIIRAAGDIKSEILSLISPMGLAQRSQVFVKNHWLPSVIILLEAVLISVIAYALNSVRDIDQGFIPAKPGRKEASIFLKSPFGLALRLLKTPLIIWFTVMFTLGASYGSVFGDIDNFIADSPTYQAILRLTDIKQ
jgi:ABC-2 type transport system permease protein